ncbi:MAG: hypothetical protein H6695_11420 [Deferribacteres bacterium]|nr:hypothetical protein [candidate division KSB1 bacterium]MCB9510787.1 hypothetical protein [Deferribacteres bacterium]
MSNNITSTSEGKIYEVFAKFKKDEPLRNIGTVIAPECELAKMYAYKLYDEWTWSEMFLVERDKIRTVIEIQ